MPKRAVFERSCRNLSLDVSVGVHIFLVVEQSSLESQSRRCAKTPILTVFGLDSCVTASMLLGAGRRRVWSMNIPNYLSTRTKKWGFAD